MTNNGGLKFLERPGKLFPVAQADDYVGGSIQIVDPETGKFDTLYDRCEGERLRGPNDLVFDGAGGFWFTDLGKTRERDSDRGVVYYAKADGSMIREAIFPLERPNGIGLSPDEKTLYVVETPTARCWAFKLSAPGQIESANGPYRGEKGTVMAGLGGYQMFDSLAVDGGGPHLRGDPDHRRGERHLAGRQPRRPVQAARHDGHQRLLRRQGPAHRLRDALDGRHAGVVRVAAAGAAPPPPEPLMRVVRPRLS